jgi:NAD(P)-dependent dehydrogenase (short-subunit alcohol dehydrogenase family)
MANVLITGTSKGIGLAAALVLARAGYTVYATMRDPSSSPELAQAADREGLPIRISAMDVDSDASVSETIRSIQNTHGPVDILVNNAGIGRRGSVEELAVSEVRSMMETNYFGALRCIQAVMPEMRKRRSGCIINVSSVGGRVSSPPLTAYAASKFALEALSEGLAQEAKIFNIRVALVEPGIIDTNMAQRLGTEPETSAYPHARRMAALFATSLQKPRPPIIVGQKILEIIESGTWKLRHPVGPDAEGYIGWRASMTDEQWIDRGAADDEKWYTETEASFGMDIRTQVLRNNQSS